MGAFRALLFLFALSQGALLIRSEEPKKCYVGKILSIQVGDGIHFPQQVCRIKKKVPIVLPASPLELPTTPEAPSTPSVTEAPLTTTEKAEVLPSSTEAPKAELETKNATLPDSKLTVKFEVEKKEDKSQDSDWGEQIHGDYLKYLEEQHREEEDFDEEKEVDDPKFNPEVATYVDDDPTNWDLQEMISPSTSTTQKTTTQKTEQHVPDSTEKKWDSWVERQLEAYLDHLKGRPVPQETPQAKIQEEPRVRVQETVQEEFKNRVEAPKKGYTIVPVVRQRSGAGKLRNKGSAKDGAKGGNKGAHKGEDKSVLTAPMRRKLEKAGFHGVEPRVRNLNINNLEAKIQQKPVEEKEVEKEVPMVTVTEKTLAQQEEEIANPSKATKIRNKTNNPQKMKASKFNNRQLKPKKRVNNVSPQWGNVDAVQRYRQNPGGQRTLGVPGAQVIQTAADWLEYMEAKKASKKSKKNRNSHNKRAMKEHLDHQEVEELFQSSGKRSQKREQGKRQEGPSIQEKEQVTNLDKMPLWKLRNLIDILRNAVDGDSREAERDNTKIQDNEAAFVRRKQAYVKKFDNYKEPPSERALFGNKVWWRRPRRHYRNGFNNQF